MNTPGTLPLNILPQLFTPFCDDICCGLFVVEILRDDSGNPRKFVGRLANHLFCEMLSLSEVELQDRELPESLCRTLALPDVIRDLAGAGTTQTSRTLTIAPGRSCSLQAHLPCPDLLTIAIQSPRPQETIVSGQAEMILASLGDACTIIDKNFTILYENETAKSVWGSNLGKHCYAVYHGRQNRCESCHALKVFDDGKIHKNEKMSRIGGKERHLEVTSAPLKDASGRIIAAVSITRDVTIRKMTEKGKEHLIRELQASLAKTKRLNGLLPICSHCKKIRDDNGTWQQLESYLRSHAEVEFSQEICQECCERDHSLQSPRKK